MATNRALALAARRRLASALSIAPPSPDEMIGSLASLPLPDAVAPPAAASPRRDPLQDALFERFRIEVPVMVWPATPRRLVRVSAQLYNAPAHYDRLASALTTLLAG